MELTASNPPFIVEKPVESVENFPKSRVWKTVSIRESNIESRQRILVKIHKIHGKES